MLSLTKDDLNSRSLETNGPVLTAGVVMGSAVYPRANEDRCKTQRNASADATAAVGGADTIISSVRTNPLLMIG